MKLSNWLLKRKNIIIFLIVIFAILLLIAIFPPKIVVFTIDRAIIDHEDAFAISKALDKISADPRVKGIVLDIDSPGGSSEAIEEIYYKIASLNQRMPIVASINSIGASGAYYIITPSDYIYAKPSSEVGAIGVIAELPQEVERPELVSSGPFKLRRTKESVLETVDLLKKEFIEIVSKHRKDKLKIDPIELSSGEVFIGIKAKNIGLIDEFGSLDDAIAKTAQLANLINYRVDNVKPFATITISISIQPSQIITNTTTIPKFYHLYLNLGEGT